MLVGENREDEDGGSTLVRTALGFGCGNTLDAMDAGFAFQEVLGAWSGDFEDDFVDGGGGGLGGGFEVECQKGAV